MFTFLWWAFACIAVICVLYCIVKWSRRFTSQIGTLELYVTNAEPVVEGVIRSLAPSIKTNRTVSMVIYCVDCTDQTVEIVSRLHLRDPWFSYEVDPAFSAENLVGQDAQVTGETSRVCRIYLGSGQNAKEAVRTVQNWLRNL